MPRHFNDWLKAYMEWTSVSESPDAFHFWTGVGTIAGALRSCVWIDENLYTYTPNFFLFFVGPPGIAAKSTSIGLGMRLLEKVPDVRFGPSSLTWQFLLREMKDATITVKWTDDNGKKHERPAAAITVEASELGTFLKLGQEGLAESLIDLWDGKISKRGLTHGTIGSGKVSVENPWLHVIGATTPSWLAGNFPATMIHGGLTSRILFIFGDKKRKFIAYPSQEVTPGDFHEKEQKLVEDLIEISKLRGPLKFTPEARKWGDAWYKDLWNNPSAPHMASIRFEGYKARKQALLHKIAIVLCAAQGDTLMLTETILQTAEKLLISTEHTMLRVFESIGIVDEAKHVREIVGIVRAYATTFPQGMTSQQIYRLVANVLSQKDFATAIVSAVQSGALERVTLGKNASGGDVFAVKLSKV